MTREQIRRILNTLNLTPSKKLGQSFLINNHYDKAIVESAKIKSEDVIIEIGSGLGNLTAHLLDAGKMLIAVEIDRRLCEYLEKKFGDRDNFQLICKDILELDIFDLKKRFLDNEKKFRIIGNIPYSASSPIIRHLICYKEVCRDFSLLLQKEVFERLSGKPGSKDYGYFTILVGLNNSVTKLLEIKGVNFYPKPIVDSTLVKFEPVENLNFKNEELLKRILSITFSQRRKMLKNTLSKAKIADLKIDDIIEILKNHGLSTNVRPEELSIEDFIHLSDIISKRISSQQNRN